ncbi:amidase [Rhizobium sp. GR12]|uniref:amidase n=1 Tax=Rhizobium sp. GR12 TaxID=3053925 RepID=UPI002FBE8C38
MPKPIRAERDRPSIGGLLAELNRGAISPAGVVDDAIREARHCQAAVNAFAEIDEIGARDAASEAEHRYREGRTRTLEGVVIAVKDMIDTRGVPTRYGSMAYVDHVPGKDAEVVRTLKDSGAIIVGKTTTHEFAWGVTTSSPDFGDTLNPHDHSRIPGGSSGGMAAAVAYGAVRAGLGTDTGGSVRIPAALCGVVGFKPTYGRLPLGGVFPLASSLDHVGVLGQTVDDVARVCKPMGIDSNTVLSPPRKRIGVFRQIGRVPLSSDVAESFDTACACLRLQYDLVELDGDNLFSQCFAAFAGIVLSEGGVAHFARHDISFIAANYGRETASRLKLSAAVELAQYANWQQTRRRFMEDIDRMISNFDLLITPTCPCVAPRIGAEEVAIGPWSGSIREALMTYTVPFNLAGLPAISLPIPGSWNEGLPVGLQAIAKRGSDEDLLVAAMEIERLVAFGPQALLGSL